MSLVFKVCCASGNRGISAHSPLPIDCGYAGVRNHPKTNVGVKIDPRTCLTLLLLGPVSKVKSSGPLRRCYVFIVGRSVKVWGLKRPQKTTNVSIF